MTALTPAAPAPTPPNGPYELPHEPAPAEELAGLRSQVAVYVVCAVAIGVVTGATSTLPWGAASMVGLAGGINRQASTHGCQRRDAVHRAGV